MSSTASELLRFRLMEQIADIEAAVAELGRPADTAQRSLIARYGKLLLVSQRLLRQAPRPAPEPRTAFYTNPISHQPYRPQGTLSPQEPR